MMHRLTVRVLDGLGIAVPNHLVNQLVPLEQAVARYVSEFLDRDDRYR